MRKRLKEFKDKTPTIISVNCIGWKFLSPTINLFFYPDDYICFVTRLHEYVKEPLSFVRTGYSGKEYPICTLGDGNKLKKIEIHFLHYNNYQECCEKWADRCNRIKWNNILLIFTDQNGCTLKNIKDFLQLPYPKMLFYGKTDVTGIYSDENTILIPVSPTKLEKKRKENPVDHCMIFKGFTGHRRYEENVNICDFMHRITYL